MKPKDCINQSMIAPCGMNCGLCYAHLRDQKRCPGCYQEDPNKPKYCIKCSIKNCPNLPASEYCSACNLFPCRRLKQFDKRYVTKYKMSPIENLKRINNIGIEAFIEGEIERWACSHCGNTICVHYASCKVCGEKQ